MHLSFSKATTIKKYRKHIFCHTQCFQIFTIAKLREINAFGNTKLDSIKCFQVRGISQFSTLCN